MVKICTKCKIEKPFDEFSKDKTQKMVCEAIVNLVVKNIVKLTKK
jgi:hypothetical protein